MRRQDFLGDFKDLKFRVSMPNEIVTTQEEMDKFAIGFAAYLDGYLEVTTKRTKTIKELLEIYKKTL